jgi:hypothetical protein
MPKVLRETLFPARDLRVTVLPFVFIALLLVLAYLALDPTPPRKVVQAAQVLHHDTGWFQRKGEFPSPKNAEWPLSPQAERFYRAGPPLLQRYLPFWLANLIERMWVVLLSIVAVLIPLSRVVPPLYEFRIRSRIFRWYGQLRVIESAQGRRRPEALPADLDALEQKVGNITVPLSYTDELYDLRSHIQLGRQRLHTPPPERTEPPAPQEAAPPCRRRRLGRRQATCNSANPTPDTATAVPPSQGSTMPARPPTVAMCTRRNPIMS